MAIPHPANVYEFSAPTDPEAPLISLSYANGFLPQTYTQSLTPVLGRFRVVSPHLRPMWQPTPPPRELHSWRQFGTDLLGQLDQIGASPGIGIGHSVGAIAVLYAATMRPERFRGVILLDPTLLAASTLRAIWLMRLIHNEARMSLVQGALKRGRHWDNAEVAYQYFRGKKLFTRWTDEAVHTYTDSIIAPDPAGGVSLVYPPDWEARIYETIPADLWRYPSRLTVPTLVIRGALSDTFTLEGKAHLTRILPQAAIVDVEGAGHLVAQEQPGIVGEHIAEFADQIFNNKR